MIPYNQMSLDQLPSFIKLKNSDGTEDIHYSLFYKGVSDDCEMIAQRDLNETKDRRKEGMHRLRELLTDQGISGVDDYILLSVLRKCKYDFNKSEKQLMRFMKTRQMILDKLQQTDMKRLEHVLDHMVVGLLPYRDKRGRPIFFTTPNINFELFNLEDCLVCFGGILFFLLSFSMTSIHGANYIMEAKTPALALIYPLLQLFRQYTGDMSTFPGRLGNIEVLNEIAIVRWTMNILRPILNPKIVGKINFYGSDVVSLRKTYHPDLLPYEFGGTMGPLSNKFYKEELLTFIKRLKNESTV